MTASQERTKRGLDGDTVTPIRYHSPPPRSPEEITTVLSKDRARGRFTPRHTPLDACAAQDEALGKAKVLEAAEQAAKLPRRDSGVNTDVAREVKTRLEEEPMAEAAEPMLSSPKLVIRPPRPRSPSRHEPKVKSSSSSSSVPNGRSPTATPIVTVRLATPPQQDVLSAASSMVSSVSPEQRSTGRRKSSRRGAIRDDLKIDGTPALAAQADPEHVTQYRDAKGKWYDVIGGSAWPPWAVEERTIIKQAQSGRRQSTYRNRGD
ncbi:hypothetical protein DOTSEDRAFT_71596 [Dothistroma septosporum NZE10]|uniref:Uncharacterized protein n=1 Tax=Dothistroma septosporum (strain NZE10 / CBS 128990) TaxID=675120 RepID=N1PN47_DOTSN|nr:hypothetical protein DOTSEDRAFT_71596 [Dothistroma septosporum NZE10]